MNVVATKRLEWVFLITLLVGCQFERDDQSQDVETDSNQDYSVQNPPTKEPVEVVLVTFVESQVEVPDRENRGKLILADGCIIVQPEHSGSRYIPIFPNSTRLVQESGQVTGVSVGQQFIQLNVPFRFSGAIVKSLEQIPAITGVSENCDLQFHSIGSVEL